MEKVSWSVARHMYYGGIVLAHEAKKGNRYVSIENFGKDYKDVSLYEFREIDTEPGEQKKMGWVVVHSTSFERMKDARAEGERWLNNAV